MHKRVMGSAHRLTERIIWVMFNENLTKGRGDNEGTSNSRVNTTALKCDLAHA